MIVIIGVAVALFVIWARNVSDWESGRRKECPQCRATVVMPSTGYGKCPKCGSPVPGDAMPSSDTSSPPKADRKTIVCPNCGKAVVMPAPGTDSPCANCEFPIPGDGVYTIPTAAGSVEVQLSDLIAQPTAAADAPAPVGPADPVPAYQPVPAARERRRPQRERLSIARAEDIAAASAKPKEATRSPGSWKWHSDGTDVQGVADVILYRIHVVWVRYGGLIWSKPREWRHYLVDLEAATGHVTKIAQVKECLECGELIQLVATRCPHCRTKF